MLPRDIYSAIKKAVADLGPEILKSRALVSILSDYQAFDVHDSQLAEKKAAITALAENGYADNIVRWQNQQDGKWQEEDVRWIDGLCNRLGLKRNVVGTIADAMKVAVGLEATCSGYTDPKKMLPSEISKYESALARLVSVKTDLLGLTTAYFSTTARTELYRYEGRILILAQAANDSTYDKGWVENTRQRVIVKHSTSNAEKMSAARKVLDEDGSAYEAAIKKQTLLGSKGKKVFGNRAELTALAERINCALEILGDNRRVDAEGDINKGRSAVKKYRRKRIILFSTIAFIVLGILTIVVAEEIDRSKHKVEIEAFDTTIAEGDRALAEGRTLEAINLYQKAKEEYTADYIPDYYHDIASDKIDNASQKIVNTYSDEIAELLSAGHCKAAKLKYEELESLPISTDLTNYKTEFYEMLTTAVNQKRDNLLKSISEKGGKPSSEEKAEIEDLLYCMPDDYYLNIIKSKMK